MHSYENTLNECIFGQNLLTIAPNGCIIYIEVKERPKKLENRITGGFKVAKATKNYKWGLFSDYGMRILNETFTTKREAQKVFREWGYTKLTYRLYGEKEEQP